jgi:AcrR family transcriptional regulator
MPKMVAGYAELARARILDAAQAVFRTKGFRRATLEDVTRKLGVSKGSIYVYFRTKVDLLAAVQERSREQVLESWSALLEEGDLAEGIARSIDEVFSGEFDPGVWHELVGVAATEPAIRAAMEVDHRQDLASMEHFLRELGLRGRIAAPEDPEVLARIVLTLLQGSVLDFMIRGDAPGARRELVRSLRYVLGQKGGPARRSPPSGRPPRMTVARRAPRGPRSSARAHTVK